MSKSSQSSTSHSTIPTFTCFRSPYRVRTQLHFTSPSRTKQSFRDECDINHILKRWERDGVISHFNRFEGSYGDFSNFGDYHESINQVNRAQEMFMSLPSKIRSQFNNDPGRFVDFASNPANLDAMVDMGLAVRRLPPAERTPDAGVAGGAAGSSAVEPASTTKK